MVNQELINYIKTEEAQGYSPEQLRTYLLQYGYPSQDVDEAIQYANNNNLIAQQPSYQTKSKSFGIKHRNPFLVLLLSLITFGLYTIYWLVSTTNELRNNTKSAPNPLLLLLLFIPIVNIFMIFVYYYKYSKAMNEFTEFSSLALFLLLVFIGPVGILISQVLLNKKVQ